MESILSDIKQSPLESFCWFLGGASLAGIGISVLNKYFKGNEDLEKWEAEIKKQLGIDRLKINKTLCFGTNTRVCSVHETGPSLCKDPDCTFGPLGQLVDAIGMARKTLDVAIFSFSSEVIGFTILERHRAGVRVRVVADADGAFGSDSQLTCLRDAGVVVRTRISPFHMHHKFIVVDEEVVINGSMNFSSTGATCNWENVVITSDPGMVQPFLEEFRTLWDVFEPGKELKFPDKPRHVRNNESPKRLFDESPVKT